MVTTTDKPVATGIQLTPLDEPFRADPYPILADLRRREPAHRDTELNRVFRPGTMRCTTCCAAKRCG